MEKKYQRIVVKIGTSSLIRPNGRTNLPSIDRLAYSLSALNNLDYEVVLVTSGAMGVGLEAMKMKKRPQEIEMQQALASIGQADLIRIYSQRFLDYQTRIGQLLITRDVFDYPISRKHTLKPINNLLAHTFIPVINENDPVSVDELDHHTTFSDNDELSSIVAKNIDADLLIVLSDIDAFYDKDPHKYPDAQPIRHVPEVTPSLREDAAGSSSGFGTGGMVTKLRAAETMMDAGKTMILCNGQNPKDILKIILNGEELGTKFGK